MWGGLTGFCPVTAADPPPRAQAPRGYETLQLEGWRWASPGGRIEPDAEFQDFFRTQLDRVRRELRASRPRTPLVVFAPDRGSFNAVVEGYGARKPGEGVNAVAFPLRDVMVLDGGRLRFMSFETYPETLVHEVVHLVLGEGGAGIPRWYHEGLAQLLSGRRLGEESRNHLAYLARKKELPGLVDLSRFLSPSHQMQSVLYQQSLAFVGDVDQKYGSDVHAEILAELRGGADFSTAFRRASGEPLDDAETRWLKALAAEFSWFRAFLHMIGLFQVLAVVLVIGFFLEVRRRRKRLRRMSLDEAVQEDGAAPEAVQPD